MRKTSLIVLVVLALGGLGWWVQVHRETQGPRVRVSNALTPEQRMAFREVFGITPENPDAQKVVLARIYELWRRAEDLGKEGTDIRITDTEVWIHPDVQELSRANELAQRIGVDPLNAVDLDPNLQAAKEAAARTEDAIRQGQELIKKWEEAEELLGKFLEQTQRQLPTPSPQITQQ